MKINYTLIYRFSSLVFIILFQLLEENETMYAQTVPANFQDQLVSTGWNEVEGFAYDANGRQYVWEKAGRVWIVDTNGVKLPTALIDINDEVGGWRDHGLNGFALDPNFLNNGYIYLMYTVDRYHLLNADKPGYNPATNEYYNATIIRVTRYTANAATNFNSIVSGSRLVLIGEDKKSGIPLLHESHSGGQLVFGRDGSLMLTTGDGASYNFADGGGGATYWSQGLADSIIRPKENIGAFRAQLVDCLAGKVLRIDPATGDGLPTNPYYDPTNPRAAKSRVWCVGLRNPFRMTIRPNTGSTDITAGDPGVLYIGDVGWGTWEDLNVAKGPGKNFGWPVYEGLTIHSGYNGLGTQNQDAPNPLFGIGGCTQQYFTFSQLLKQASLGPIPVFTNPCNAAIPIPANIPVFMHERPAIDWKHGNQSRTGTWSGNNAAEIDLDAVASPVPGPRFGGNASVGGVWYTGTAYPLQYQNTYFHGDYGTQWIRNFSFDSNNNPVAAREFETGSGACVFIGYNPRDQTINYVRYPDQIRRLKYLGTVNNPPTAVAKRDTSYGASPLIVNFNGSSSIDPENLALSYLWKFGNGDSSILANPQYTYTVGSGLPTSYYASLKVTDNINQVSYDSVLISVNNTPPVVQITSFQDGDLFTTAGFTNLPLQAQVTDLEHAPGQLKYKWETFLHHNNHEHPESPDTNKTTLTVLSPLACNEVLYFRISLTVTDEAGLSTQVSSSIYPACNVPDAAFQADNTNPCRGALVQFTDQSTNLPTSYLWDFPGGTPSSSTLKNPLIKYTSGGLKTASLIVINPIGTDTLTLTNYINVHNPPAPVVTPNGPITFCYGNNVTLHAIASGNPGYVWRKDGKFITGATSSNYIAAVTGSYKAIVTNQYGCSGGTIPVLVTVEPDAKITLTGLPTFCAGDSVLLTVNSGTGYSYQWFRNNSIISNATNQMYYAKTSGNYTVMVSTLSGCSRVSYIKKLTVNCKLQHTDSSIDPLALTVIPNPAHDEALVSFSLQASAILELKVYDALGKLILQTPSVQYFEGSQEILVDLSKLHAGIYFCTITSDGMNRTAKLVVSK